MPSDGNTAKSQELVDDGTVGAGIAPPPSISETQTVAVLLTEHIGYQRQQTRVLQEDAEQLHQTSHYIEWAVRTSKHGRSSTQEMIDKLADLGFAWRHIAQLVGVSVPAVQKWRRGERTTGQNRQKVAGLLAACDLVSEHYGVQEVASWFEMPLLPGVPVTPVDLWSAERADLVFGYASGHVDPEQVLTTWDGQWRERYRSDFESFPADDGHLSIRLKDR